MKGHGKKMAHLIFDKLDYDPKDAWTTERLKEEFFLCLANVKEKIYSVEGKAVTVRKYYAQARYKMYLIPKGSRSMFTTFVMHNSDLTERVREDFIKFCKVNTERKLVIFLKEVAGRFFENMDFEYYHTSIMKSLRVRLIS